ncbi:D-alanyl-D-alanine carboxypeptidase family protein [Natranaerofaba carboxydovora]|uniref:D-alanyl-D-alanine carboxypeptidase family protein n=1 Tax=Natranaerofaba carboxydovora TaxID=2742683 RepID=UPI001F143EA8|nr:D-alanyl-D-alanine carboxypeptidase family protein [Natranaerofaba carboxydovora]UMZ75260.1 D-alanyl-D-alanine carboxypeptidase DacB [Natranaerofaba carboxydovora]
MINVKKLTVLILVVMIFFGNAIISTISASSDSSDIDIYADAAVLIEVENGQVLYDKNKHESMYPASTTKIMTAHLLLQNSSLSEQVEVTENAFRVRGSTLHLNKGMTLSVRDLLYGIMLRSANDGAIAAAEHVSGSKESFVEKMNQKAKEYGAKNTGFQNPHGLTNGYPDHNTTAYDLAMITRQALKCPEFRRIVNTTEDEIKLKDGTRELYNPNRLLKNYQYANGVKTGYTAMSGHTLVASATKDDITLVAVILGSDTRNALFNSAENLFDYVFENYEKIMVSEKNELVDSINIEEHDIELDVYTDSEVSYMVNTKEQSNPIEERNSLKDSLSLPLEKNDKIGEMMFFSQGEEIGATNLIIKEDVERPEAKNTSAITFVLIAGGVVTGFFVFFKNKKDK